MCSAIIIYSSTMKLTHERHCQNHLQSHMFNKRVSDLKRAVTGRRSFNHTAFLRCVCVSGVQKPNVCSKAQEVQVLIDYWGFSDDPDQLVFALCRNPSRSAEADLRREAAGRWPHALRLQHPEGEPGTPPQRNEGFSVNVDSEFSLRFRASVIQRSSDELLLCFGFNRVPRAGFRSILASSCIWTDVGIKTSGSEPLWSSWFINSDQSSVVLSCNNRLCSRTCCY